MRTSFAKRLVATSAGMLSPGSLQGSELGLPIRRLQKLNGISYREPTVSISIVTFLILGLVQPEV